ncbi:hypothetical protein PQ465_20890 [Sphingobacterium oryzagri]|uniref:Cardiolipin synthase N-terminal domain-containing protein n=1 Tax=Sphingobacterium oryzagri TaxID=3025669 RepID=A0ABY7WHT9_9SPHI|nr:hypothetical protein [Sphingobacterium sp. KACC 22765]WDF68738.1 hypothetical protein PQ465_20890 [Sphingobacterium sp. KACC 22765]
MRNLSQQTKQAFFFSLGFYILALMLKLFDFYWANVFISIGLLLSLVWTVLVLRELMLSTKVSNGERLLLIIFIIFGNIVAGLIYFFLIRDRVLATQKK